VEKATLAEGDLITLGTTTLRFSRQPPEPGEPAEPMTRLAQR